MNMDKYTRKETKGLPAPASPEFRPLAPEHDAAVAELVRSNLRQFGLDIPGTAYFDEASGIRHQASGTACLVFFKRDYIPRSE